MNDNPYVKPLPGSSGSTDKSAGDILRGQLYGPDWIAGNPGEGQIRAGGGDLKSSSDTVVWFGLKKGLNPEGSRN